MTKNLQGALWILVAATCAAGMSLSIRGLNGNIPLMEIVFVRCVIGILLVLLFSWHRGTIHIRTRKWKLMVLRSVLTVGALSCGFYAISVLPLTTATVLFFTAPLFVTLLAVPFFGETVGWRRGLAAVAGFVGTVIVLRPGIDGFDPNMLYAILSSLIFAAILLIGKKLSETDTIGTMMFYAMMITSIASMPMAVINWQMPSWHEWALLCGVAGFGTLRGFSDTKGYAIGEASVMAPFQYFRILVVTAAGYFIFAEIPDLPTIIGAGIIIFSSLCIVRREATISKGGENAPRAGIAAP